MDGEALDESFLFANFEEQNTSKSRSKKSKKRRLSGSVYDDGSAAELPGEVSKAIEQKDKYIQQLEDQNNKLKSVIKRLCGPQSSNEKANLWEAGSLELMPMAVVLYLNNELSVASQNEVEEAMFKLLARVDGQKDKEPFSLDAKLQPSAVPLRAFAVDSKGKRTHIAKTATTDPHVYSAIHYCTGFCIDRLGLPLLEHNPSISELWSIPVYEQVFFNVLPVLDDDGRKVFVKHRRTKHCFNCFGDHTVNECDKPRDQAVINSNRQEFMKKFGGSPVSDSRYHQGEQERFKDFKPGIISDSLREALMIPNEELPPYIYRMRDLGYPPGYLKSKKSNLLMYGKEGEIQDSYGEEGEIQPDTFEQEVLYPGFNAPVEEGIIDRSIDYGMQPFDVYYAAKWGGASSVHTPSYSTPPYHQSYNERHINEDMDVEDTLGAAGDALQSQNEEHMITNHLTSTPRASTSLDIGMQPPLPDYTPEPAPPPPCDDPAPSPLTSSPLTSVEIGQLLEKTDRTVKKSKVIDTYLAQSSTVAHFNEDSTNRRWWDQEPLSTSSGILYLTYTPPPTIQQKVGIKDVFKYTASDLDREPWKTDSTSWYDPLYGDLSAPTGIYDAIKEILKKREKKGRRKSSL